MHLIVFSRHCDWRKNCLFGQLWLQNDITIYYQDQVLRLSEQETLWTLSWISCQFKRPVLLAKITFNKTQSPKLKVKAYWGTAHIDKHFLPTPPAPPSARPSFPSTAPSPSPPPWNVFRALTGCCSFSLEEVTLSTNVSFPFAIPAVGWKRN